MKRRHIQLDPNGVAAPAQRAAMISSDVIAASLTALAEGELTKPSMPNQFIRYQVRGPEITSDERREMYENWLLAKGFQDLARGVRESLEEAFLYLNLVKIPSPQRITLQTVQDMLDTTRKRASLLKFPTLFAKVNAGLTAPVQFEKEFLSIQKARNCLEHRGGIVGKQDINDENETILTLSFPRMKLFYMRGDEEIEVAPNEPVNAQDGEAYVDILGRYVTRSKTYGIGERIKFTPAEFSEIAMSCSFFGTELAGKLPILAA
jgi:hypothetical protein